MSSSRLHLNSSRFLETRRLRQVWYGPTLACLYFVPDSFCPHWPLCYRSLGTNNPSSHFHPVFFYFSGLACLSWSLALIQESSAFWLQQATTWIYVFRQYRKSNGGVR